MNEEAIENQIRKHETIFNQAIARFRKKFQGGSADWATFAHSKIFDAMRVSENLSILFLWKQQAKKWLSSEKP
jgi:hypothetical protein